MVVGLLVGDYSFYIGLDVEVLVGLSNLIKERDFNIINLVIGLLFFLFS